MPLCGLAQEKDQKPPGHAFPQGPRSIKEKQRKTQKEEMSEGEEFVSLDTYTASACEKEQIKRPGGHGTSHRTCASQDEHSPPLPKSY